MSFEKINLWLTGSASLNLLFLTLAIVSLLVSIYFYVKSKREKLPVYIVRKYPLIEDKVAAVSGLNISFNGLEISNLNLTKIAVWNNGRDTIHRTDIASADRLRIALVGGGVVLGAKCSFVSKEVNCINLSVEKDLVFIDFDFLDYSDGAVIDLYHSGKGDIKLKGTLKGVTAIKKAVLEEDELLDRFLAPIINLIPKPKNRILRALLLVVVFIITFPIGGPLVIIEAVVRRLQAVPKEYALGR
jgi:hypothetical protein